MAVSRAAGSGSPSSRSRSASTRVTRSRASVSCKAGALAVLAEHRGVHLLDRPAVAEVHVHAAGQARVEGADRAHDVDPAELLLAALLEDGLAHHRVLVGAGGAVGVRRAAVPWR